MSSQSPTKPSKKTISFLRRANPHELPSSLNKPFRVPSKTNVFEPEKKSQESEENITKSQTKDEESEEIIWEDYDYSDEVDPFEPEMDPFASGESNDEKTDELSEKEEEEGKVVEAEGIDKKNNEEEINKNPLFVKQKSFLEWKINQKKLVKKRSMEWIDDYIESKKRKLDHDGNVTVTSNDNKKETETT